MDCPICNQSMKLHLEGKYNRCGYHDYHFTLQKCETCQFYATYPSPSNESYDLSHDEDGKFISMDTRKWNKALLKRVLKYKKKGELLEIGPNAGNFLEMATDAGFDCLGVEIDEVAAKEGIRLGRNIVQADALTYKFNKKFDVIVMNHVLEHIPQIKEVPQKIYQLLKDDGVVVLNIPHYHGLIAQIMQEKWCLMAPFTHLWFFTRKSTRLFFQKYFSSIRFYSNTNGEPIGLRPFSIKNCLKYLIVKLANIIQMGDELGIVLKK